MARIDWTRDELLLACALVAQNDWHELRQGDESVLELSDLLRSLPTNRDNAASDPRFRSPNSVSRKTTDVATAHPSYPGAATRGGRPTKAVVRDFLAHPAEMLAAADAIRLGIGSGELHRIPPQPDEAGDDGETTAPEGQLLARWALYRERDRGLRDRKIQQARRRGQAVQCEVCSFDFKRFYGALGDGYIEVHHTLPLHISGPTETRLDDLAFLCANCHRMCHKSFDGESWRTPDDLRAIIRAPESDADHAASASAS
ncbi:HNH endonuclease [Streptomyces sp. MZ04]|uniref:HNH endonuclease n=1 Tax=Streptomyces sp. MZ04 TaxID=2559236 RepID=UPI00107E8309|nr:HNH endonuclease [Streptomyces sp. MZ04]TGB00990.1 HNH endonuclease [Streptomyces sp. MZ04]